MPLCSGCFKFLERSKADAKDQAAETKKLFDLAKKTDVTIASSKFGDDASPKSLRSLGQSPSRFTMSSWRAISGVEATPALDPDIVMLNKCFDLFKQGRSMDAVAHLAEDCVWHTLYDEEIKGRTAIIEWRDAEMRKGRRNRAEGYWVKDPDGKIHREMKVVFPSKATHQVIQTVELKDGYISVISVKPKFSALSTALKFAIARANEKDEEALQYLADDVRWKAWDGFHVDGKEGIRKLFREQRMKEVKRHGESEFEAAQVNDQGGVFERLLYVERIDGIKVKAKQRLYVRSELCQVEPVTLPKGVTRKCYGVQPKIIEVKVLATEEMIDGSWVVAEDGNM